MAKLNQVIIQNMPVLDGIVQTGTTKRYFYITDGGQYFLKWEGKKAKRISRSDYMHWFNIVVYRGMSGTDIIGYYKDDARKMTTADLT